MERGNVCMTNKKESEEINEAENTKKSTKPKGEKKTLIELVENSSVNIISIIMDLSKNGLLDQYNDEKDKKRLGLPIEASLTETEFNKIIGD